MNIAKLRLNPHALSAAAGALVVILAGAAVGVGLSAESQPAGGGVHLVYMSKVKAQKQGDIKGEVNQKGREGWFRATRFDYEVKSPRDAATGQASGKRQQRPISISRDVSEATPQFFQALVTNETFPEIEFRFFGAGPVGGAGSAAGVETQRLTIRLVDASLSNVSYQLVEKDNRPQLIESLEFVFGRIEISTPGGKSASDDWVKQK